MKSYTGPLLIIAAAIFWYGSGAFHAGGKSGSESCAIGGSIVSAALLLWGIVFTVRNR